MRRLATLCAVFVVLAYPARAWADAPSAPPPRAVTYRAPVDAPVVDDFRAPGGPYGPGNRGLEYAPEPGTPVVAAADGEVVFAGPVGGSLHVVVLHADGIRTSYSFLRSLRVHRADRVRQGQAVGVAGDRLHFGARAGDAYVDPAVLLDGGPAQVHLVPEEARRPGTEEQERRGLLRLLADVTGRVADAGTAAVGWAARTAGDGLELAGDHLGNLALDAAARGRALVSSAVGEARGIAYYVAQAQPTAHVLRVARAAEQWWHQHHHCTPASVRPPPPPRGHLAVLVGGLGSSSDHAAIDKADTAGLGYAPADVVRFSYRGGTTAEQPYLPSDTTVGIRQSGRRLRALLARLHAEHPGKIIDVLAHSQGGLVVRAAMAYEADRGDPRLPPIRSVVTLGSPHQGADLATAAAMTGHSLTGRFALGAARPVAGYDFRSRSVRQMAQTSRFLRRLNQRPLPAGTRFTSIGARGDLVVPAVRTQLKGAANITVSVDGATGDHSALPGSPAARREMALALAGLPPTCKSLEESVVDAVTSDAIARAEDGVGVALWSGGRATSRVGGIDAFFPAGR